jgi:hypothetical protein
MHCTELKHEDPASQQNEISVSATMLAVTLNSLEEM